MLSDINQTERDKKLYYMLYVGSNKAKHVEIESRSVVTRS